MKQEILQKIKEHTIVVLKQDEEWSTKGTLVTINPVQLKELIEDGDFKAVDDGRCCRVDAIRLLVACLDNYDELPVDVMDAIGGAEAFVRKVNEENYPMDKNGRIIDAGKVVRLTATMDDYGNLKKFTVVFDGRQLLLVPHAGGMPEPLETYRNTPTMYHNVELC